MSAPQKRTRRGPTRRRLMAWLGVAGAGAGATVAVSPAANAYYQGPKSDHFDGVKFFNPGGRGPKGLLDLIKWNLSKSEPWPDTFPSPLPPLDPADHNRPSDSTVAISFIGHASYLIETAGANILIDPVYSDRASPVSFAGPKRHNPPGLPFDKLPPIDAVLITHNHYDHLDIATLTRLQKRDKPRFIAPLGNDTIIRDAIPGVVTHALDWDGTTAVAGSKGQPVSVTAVPTQHWSARGTRDRMHALWASFVIKTAARTIYAVGDTGFGDGRTFRHVRERHPSIDVALLPIGAYEPRWFMQNQHMNPAEAVEALKLCGATRALGHHWGTFRLTNEAIDDPPKALTAAKASAGVADADFVAVRPGHRTILD